MVLNYYYDDFCTILDIYINIEDYCDLAEFEMTLMYHFCNKYYSFDTTIGLLKAGTLFSLFSIIALFVICPIITILLLLA